MLLLLLLLVVAAVMVVDDDDDADVNDDDDDDNDDYDGGVGCNVDSVRGYLQAFSFLCVCVCMCVCVRASPVHATCVWIALPVRLFFCSRRRCSCLRSRAFDFPNLGVRGRTLPTSPRAACSSTTTSALLRAA